MNQDEYTKPEGPYVRNHRTRTLSENNPATIKAGGSLMAILSALKVSYDGDQIPLRITNEFWPDGTPLSLMPDARIHDGRYWDGVFEVDGRAHLTHGSRRWDERKDAYYAKMGLWVCRLKNSEVSMERVRAELESHGRKVDEYGGVVP